ncbi:MAG: hypothetical protein GF350_03440 [Chitinivibrionales bacterium]|nr:hypothetical protein [Chitinivibrionales bacterium]
MKQLLLFFIPFVLLLAAGCSELGQEPEGVALGQCSICHAVPPSTAQHVVHVLDPDLHFDCEACHEGYSADPLQVVENSHNNGDTNVIFSDYRDPEQMGTYDAATKTCSNLYCHGYFERGNAVSIQIGERAGCGSCHGNQEEHDPTTRNRYHEIHVTQQGYKCSACHPGYGTRGVNDSLHVNMTIDVDFSSTFDPSGTGQFNKAQASCSNIYCHGAFDQGAGDSIGINDIIGGNCAACHDTAAILAGHHSFNDARDNVRNCNQCHYGYYLTEQIIDSIGRHANGSVDLDTVPF